MADLPGKPLYISKHAVERFRERTGSGAYGHAVAEMHRMIRIGTDSCPAKRRGRYQSLWSEVITYTVRAVLSGSWIFVIDIKRNTVTTCYLVNRDDFVPVEYTEEEQWPITQSK